MDNLPVELIELMAEHLNDLDSLRSLRLVCQDLQHKVAATRHFIRACAWKRVELRVESLEKLESTLRQSGVASHLQHLVLVGVLCIPTGLERTLREKTITLNVSNPIGQSLDFGLSTNAYRVRASKATLKDTEAQLAHFRWRIKTENERRANGENVRTLTSLFNTIRTHCRSTGLKNLALDVVVYREKSTLLQPNVGARPADSWPFAEYILRVTAQAWRLSGVSIENFNAYGYLDACCVQTTVLPDIRPSVDALRKLRSLTLSLSKLGSPYALRSISHDPDAVAYCKPADHQGPAIAADNDELIELAVWLRHCQDLERLDLSWYHFPHQPCNATDSSRLILQNVAREAPLGNLKMLRLRHFSVRVQDLIRLLRTSPLLLSFDVRETTLLPSKNDGWNTIFGILTSPASRIDNLYLDNLFVKIGSELAYVSCDQNGPNEIYIQSERGAWLCRHAAAAYGANSFYLQTREQVLAGFAHHIHRNAWRTAEQNSIWLRERQMTYGCSIV